MFPKRSGIQTRDVHYTVSCMHEKRQVPMIANRKCLSDYTVRLHLCFLRPTRVHNPNGKSIFSRFRTAHSRVSFGKFAPPGKHNWICAHRRHLANTIELVLPLATRVHNPNSKSISSATFAQLTAESPYTLQWAPLSPKIAPSHGGSGPPSDTIPWAHPSPKPI